MRRLILSAILACACIAPATAQEPPALQTEAARAQLRASLLAQARAAVAAGQGAAARRHAARLLWQLEPPAEEARAARLIVIDSYVAERDGESAFRAMLRFQQDHASLDRATAVRFVEQLLALDLEKYAVVWLARLDDASPVKLTLRLRAGLVAADSVVAQARAELAKGGGAAYWRVVAEAAQRQKDAVLRVEALEHLLNSGADGAARQAAAVELWQTYLTAAQDVANRTHMLVGDDGAWADHAARQLGANAYQARALFAHLAQRGRERATRLNAQLQLVYSLQQARLERTALSLFDAGEPADAALDAQARYLLGSMAERANLPDLALRYWSGLAVPPGASAEEWQARLAAVHWRGGKNDVALSMLHSLLERGKTLEADAVKRVAAVAQEMAAAGKIEEAAGVLRGLAVGNREDARAQFQWLLKHATDPAQRDIARRELSKL